MYDKEPLKTDIFKRLCTVSKPAFELFDSLKDTRDPYTNICYLPVKGLSRSQLTMFRSRIKELKDAGIIRKAQTIDRRKPIKKGSYMLNPELLKCAYDPEGSEATWNLLK